MSFYYPPISEHALEMEQVIQREPPPGSLEEFKSDHLTNLPIERPSNNEIETPERAMEVDLEVDHMTCKSLLPVLFDALQIPAGMHPFHRIPLEWNRNPLELAGFQWIPEEFKHSCRNGTEIQVFCIMVFISSVNLFSSVM